MGTENLTWTANSESDLAGYKVYRSFNSDPLQLLTAVGKVTTYTDATIPAMDGLVNYALTAFDDSGNESAKSTTVSVRVDTIPPAAPTGLAVVAA